jgi:hypothetical protein
VMWWWRRISLFVFMAHSLVAALRPVFGRHFKRALLQPSCTN